MDGGGFRLGLNRDARSMLHCWNRRRCQGLGTRERPQLWDHPNSEPLATEGREARLSLVMWKTLTTVPYFSHVFCGPTSLAHQNSLHPYHSFYSTSTTSNVLPAIPTRVTVPRFPPLWKTLSDIQSLKALLWSRLPDSSTILFSFKAWMGGCHLRL